MSMEYCFNCDAHYDTDYEEGCPKCENEYDELSTLFRGIYSEIQIICEDYKKREGK